MEVLAKQRNNMMDHFPQILWWLPTTIDATLSSGHFGGVAPFKVQVNFYIPIFESQIDADALEKWLNMLEGYFFVHNFSDRKRSPSHSLRISSMSNIGGKITVRKFPQKILECSRSNPPGNIL